MERCQVMMGMPITVSIPPMLGIEAPEEVFQAIFAFFREVDETFSPFRPQSEVSRIGRGEEAIEDASPRMREVLRICDETTRQTDGYFSAWYGGRFDPSGVVKGWAIRGASRLLDELGYMSHCIDAGGDIEARGTNAEGKPWEIGIRNPFDPATIIKVLHLTDRGIATSGTYFRGDHIFNPKTGQPVKGGVASLTVVGFDVCEADRLTTPAFAMGEQGIGFLASTPGIDAYIVDSVGIALFTPGLARYME